MKRLLLLIALGASFSARSQDIKSIHVNLYTDSLKKGTLNYINVDGLLSNGRYLPLDSTQLTFTASAGRFEGNSLWVAPDTREDKITIRVVLKKDPSMQKEFSIYVKKAPDPQLKTMDQIMNGSGRSKRGG